MENDNSIFDRETLFVGQEKKTGIGEGARDTARRVKFVVDAVAGTRDLETQLYRLPRW